MARSSAVRWQFGVLALVLAVLAWWFGLRTPTSVERDEPRADRESTPPVTLSGAPPGAHTPASPSELPSAGKGVERRERVSGESLAAPARVGSPFRARLDLVDGAARREPLKIDRVVIRGEVWNVWGTSSRLRVNPGDTLVVATEDRRAAITAVTLEVPDPVPDEFALEVPTWDDPRIERLTLEVVDASSGRPIAGATLDWDDGAPRSGSQRANESGRIEVSRSEEGEPRLRPALVQFLEASWSLHALGYRTRGKDARRETIPTAPASELATWLETGVLRLTLDPIDGRMLESRTLRVVRADGTPAEGAKVDVFGTWEAEASGPVWTLVDRGDGWRRVPADGVVSLPVADVVGVSVEIRGSPIGLWGLAKDGWPTRGPRTLELPRLASLELMIEGVPASPRVTWTTDRLGPHRTPQDPPVFEPVIDDASRRILAQRGHALIHPTSFAYGQLASPRGTVRLTLVVGRPQGIWVSTPTEARWLEVRPDGPGPLRITRSWADLERAP